ncbi:hypothetical protein V5O48_005040 [Marasmius crinis-equi]|uniref:Uncharacterized protein n=1 Tax=Marasmius crinis-equi TaxID=585013 RepID=A0ABR3FNH1_9AGAR
MAAPSWTYDTPDNRVFVTFFHILAILFTISRLARRIRIKLLAWDDAWAAMAALFIIAHLTTRWIGWKLVDKRPSMDDATYVEQAVKVVLLRGVWFTATTWSSRISLALSIARILPPNRLRMTAVALAVSCFLAGSTILTVKAVLLSVPLPDEGSQQINRLAAFQNFGLSDVHPRYV